MGLSPLVLNRKITHYSQIVKGLCFSISAVKDSINLSILSPLTVEAISREATLPMVLRMMGFFSPLNLGESVIKKSSKKGYCFNSSSILVLAFIPMEVPSLLVGWGSGLARTLAGSKVHRLYSNKDR